MEGASPPSRARGVLVPYGSSHAASQSPQRGAAPTSHSGGPSAGSPGQASMPAVIVEMQRALEEERSRRHAAEALLRRVEAACNATVGELNQRLTDAERENATLRAALRESRFQREIDLVRADLDAEAEKRVAMGRHIAASLGEHEHELQALRAAVTTMAAQLQQQQQRGATPPPLPLARQQHDGHSRQPARASASPQREAPARAGSSVPAAGSSPATSDQGDVAQTERAPVRHLSPSAPRAASPSAQSPSDQTGSDFPCDGDGQHMQRGESRGGAAVAQDGAADPASPESHSLGGGTTTPAASVAAATTVPDLPREYFQEF